MQSARMIWAEGEALDIGRDMRSGGVTGIHPARDGYLYLPAGPGWGDRFGPGTRIPTLLVGPTVKRGSVDSTPYDTTSILKFITERFQLEPLPGVRANMGDLSNALQ